MSMCVRLALATRQPLSEVLGWEPETVVTALVWLKEQADAAKEAAKGR